MIVDGKLNEVMTVNDKAWQTVVFMTTTSQDLQQYNSYKKGVVLTS